MRKPLLLAPNKATWVDIAVPYLYKYLNQRETSSNKYITPEVLETKVKRFILESRVKWRNSLWTATPIPTLQAKDMREELNYFT